MKDEYYIAVDLDGTLAYYEKEYMRQGIIGPPIPKMMERVRKWIENGETVKIFTARAADFGNFPLVRKWLEDNGLSELEIINEKDHFMKELWDDRCIQVETNTGERINGGK
jgi:hypothetical protein